MAKEIERKFLIKNHSYIGLSHKKVKIIQGYLSTDPDATVRIRIFGDKAFITVKSRNIGAVRSEWEYEIPLEDAEQILNESAKNILSKTRYFVDMPDGLTWEIDCFEGKLHGLILAEVELPDESAAFIRPTFIGEEVTGDPRYYNSILSSQA